MRRSTAPSVRPKSAGRPILGGGLLRAELEEVTAALRVHLASWPYAFAMAGGGHGGSQRPALPVVRDETTRLHVCCSHVEARLAELT